MCWIRNAEAKNDTELITKATRRPSKAVTMPPKAAPEVRAKDQVAEERALAGSISSTLATSGRMALRDGSKTEEKITSRPSSAYTSQTSEFKPRSEEHTSELQ